MKNLLKLFVLIALTLGTLNLAPDIKVTTRSRLSTIESVPHAEAATNPTKEKKAVVEPEKKPEVAVATATTPTPPAPAPVDPNGCEAKGMWWRADNYECIAKPAPVAPSVARAPASVSSTGSGSCAAEIAKYGWNQSVALAVARAESGLNPGNLNNNPRTGDYSVGCFQINIYGANARNRPSEAALKDAATNVAFAYKIYVANGNSFRGQWGVCRTIACY